MDIFSLREALVEDYKSFTSSFVQPHDDRIGRFLDERLENADQWPDLWLSLNPSFPTGGTPRELAAAGLLEPACERIFRVKDHPEDVGRDPIVFHRHQRDAIEVARTGAFYVLTTGTGSGKSLAYIAPIVDRILRERATARPGVKAIVVYPMNALANSQVEELRKFLHYGFSPSEHPVTFSRYTGQEKPDERLLWDSDRRAILRAELDGAFFHLYGVSRDDAECILSTFPIANRKDPLLAQRVLEAYDRIAQVIETGPPVASTLDPPPGHGRRHEEKT